MYCWEKVKPLGATEIACRHTLLCGFFFMNPIHQSQKIFPVVKNWGEEYSSHRWRSSKRSLDTLLPCFSPGKNHIWWWYVAGSCKNYCSFMALVDFLCSWVIGTGWGNPKPLGESQEYLQEPELYQERGRIVKRAYT